MTRQHGNEHQGMGPSIRFFRGMRGTLLACFLLLALAPMAIVGVIAYLRAQEALADGFMNRMVAVRELKRQEVGRLFQNWASDLRLVARNETLLNDLVDMKAGFAFLGAGKIQSLYGDRPDLADAEDGSGYSVIHQEEHTFFTDYLEEKGYEDALLLSPDGSVIYSAKKGPAFATNLASGPCAKSNLGALYKALAAGKAGMVQAVDAALFNGKVALFMGIPLERGGVRLGALAFRVPYAQAHRVIAERRGMGRTGETYLVGPDLRMRSDSFVAPETHSIRASLTGTVAQNGADTASSRAALEGRSGVGRFPDYRGVEVLSAYAPLGVPGLNWAIVADIDADEAAEPARALRRIVLGLMAAAALLAFAFAFYISRRIVFPIRRLTEWSEQVASGDLSMEEIATPDNEIGVLNGSFRAAVRSLQKAEAEQQRSNWLKTGQSGLEDHMRGDLGLDELCRNIITFISNYLEARVGALYVLDGEDGAFRLLASYAYTARKKLSNVFRPGEGLVGQAALERHPILLSNVPEDYITVSSGLGETPPRHILVLPFLHDRKVVGVLEIGSLEPFSEIQQAFLSEVSGSIAIAVQAGQARVELQHALSLTQKQAEDLKAQQEELRASNEELEEKTQQLQASEEELKTQQEELKVTNEELEEKTRNLEEQGTVVRRKNLDLERTQRDLQQKARELEVTSKYKSEFLANMSHELRTPLNSLLILAQDLAANKPRNLEQDQVEAAEIIHKSGQDLLELINEILDLSKIEAGRMTLNVEDVSLGDVMDGVLTDFRSLAESKGLALKLHLAEDLPRTIQTDRQRLGQILRNLVSNALKFTHEGSVSVTCRRPGPEDARFRSGLDPEKALILSVSDTGIGVPEDKHLQIFEAFQQADGSTSRVYGGTGLGLSITRELVRILGGEIRLESAEGEGATFDVLLPQEWRSPEEEGENGRDENLNKGSSGPEPGRGKEDRPSPAPPRPPAPALPDDRDTLEPGDRTVLVIEDDLKFAQILYNICHDHDFKCLHAGDGETGLDLVERYGPDAVILDIRLPGMHGWAVLDALKNNTRTRHIPVHVMSVEEGSLDALRKGAMGFLTKPVDKGALEEAFGRIQDLIERKIKNLLVVEDNAVLRANIVDLIGNGDVRTEAVESGELAVSELTARRYDCVILDLNLPDISGFEVLRRLDASGEHPLPPVIIYTGRDLTREEEQTLQQYASSIIVKGVRSQERLLDETALFLHRVVDRLPDQKKRMISRIHDGDELFQDKRILVADDDMRNVYAVSKVLEDRGMAVFKAADGRKALDILEREPDMDLVLMDIMMPEMDGYETIGRIRAQERFGRLPILAITAKAMKEDRERCIAAGANDYLSKPVDIDRLLSLMRVWLYR